MSKKINLPEVLKNVKDAFVSFIRENFKSFDMGNGFRFRYCDIKPLNQLHVAIIIDYNKSIDEQTELFNQSLKKIVSTQSNDTNE